MQRIAAVLLPPGTARQSRHDSTTERQQRHTAKTAVTGAAADEPAAFYVQTLKLLNLRLSLAPAPAPARDFEFREFQLFVLLQFHCASLTAPRRCALCRNAAESDHHGYVQAGNDCRRRRRLCTVGRARAPNACSRVVVLSSLFSSLYYPPRIDAN